MRILISSGFKRCIGDVLLKDRRDQILGAILVELANRPLASRMRKLARDLALVAGSFIATPQAKTYGDEQAWQQLSHLVPL